MTIGARFAKWGLGLFLFIAIYFAGALLMFGKVWRALDTIPRTA